MKSWFGGRWWGLLGLLAIAALVAGGLGWATHAALSLEQKQLGQQAAAELAEKSRLALWRMDNRMTGHIATEDTRLFGHYSAIFAPPLALANGARAWPAGEVLEPSPLLSAALEPWMLLHFQADLDKWESPQVLSGRLEEYLRQPGLAVDLTNVTAARKGLLARLSRDLPAKELLAAARRHTGPTTIADRVLLAKLNEQDSNKQASSPVLNLEQQGWREYAARRGTQLKTANPGRSNSQRLQRELAMNCVRNGEEWLNNRLAYLRQSGPLSNGPGYSTSPRVPAPPASEILPKPNAPSGTPAPVAPPPPATVPAPGGAPVLPVKPLPGSAQVEVRMSPFQSAWVPTASGEKRLLLMRLVKLGGRRLCQGIVLDADGLAALLIDEVKDLLPAARLCPVSGAEPGPLDMAKLPFRLEPGEIPPPSPGWTGLRVGLLLSWVAALVALLAVGLGGWGLLELSAGRVRFVSAVTHELRTPLTTLRLYLDMLLGGLVQDEAQKQEYLRTLHAETDRLSRLVSNVLDFSRLENQAPQLVLAPLDVAALLSEVQAAWRVRCEITRKELLVENAAPAGVVGQADLCLLTQVLGNLLDNACKYTLDAEDRRLWLRARQEGASLLFEVEDRGPGIPAGERSAVFSAFCRGQAAGEATGGVGLGLALARRWVELMGGRLTLHAPAEGGACFRVELPLKAGREHLIRGRG